MTIKLIILDFDGTLTEVEKEALPYLASYKQDLQKLLSLSVENFENSWNDSATLIKNHPFGYGWKSDNKIVAPALADPYILCQTIANIIMDRFSLYQEPLKRIEVLDTLYKDNYLKCNIVFRDQAEYFLETLCRHFHVCVVTNSRTDTVNHKLNILLKKPLPITVFGNAKKYALVSDFSEIPESLNFAGFERPVYLRRKYYHQVIQEILYQQKTHISELLVFGDIFELDLALPLYLKSQLGFITKISSLDGEKSAVLENSGFVVDHLEDALKNILSRK